MIASANRVLEQIPNVHALLHDPPAALTQGPVPTRVVGHGTGRSHGSESPDGVVLEYEGGNLPRLPGFAVALVDDSSEVFRGVLVFETEPPPNYPLIGGVRGPDAPMLPLIGLRINWGTVNSDRCPLFKAIDSTAAS